MLELERVEDVEGVGAELGRLGLLGCQEPLAVEHEAGAVDGPTVVAPDGRHAMVATAAHRVHHVLDSAQELLHQHALKENANEK